MQVVGLVVPVVCVVVEVVLCVVVEVVAAAQFRKGCACVRVSYSWKMHRVGKRSMDKDGWLLGMVLSLEESLHLETDLYLPLLLLLQKHLSPLVVASIND